jgi:nucleoside-diphosphate-sugar epimerase
VNVLITDGCEYVGTKLTQAVLAGTTHNVTVLDTQWFGNHLPPAPRLTIRKADVRTIDEFDLSSSTPCSIWPTSPTIRLSISTRILRGK